MKGKGWLGLIAVTLFSLALGLGVLAAEPEAEKAKESAPPMKAKAARVKKFFPLKDFRSWSHVKTMLILEKHPLYNPFGGIHHVYINKKGLESYKTGKNYPEGTIIVFDLYEAKLENQAYLEGTHKFTATMVKNTKAHAETGGWGFDMFAGPNSESQVKNAKKECFECHSQAKDRDYVFSKYSK